jgi:uncharacterized protein DUF4055
MLPRWQLMTDVLDGEDAVKRAGSKYLPIFVEGDEEDYSRYKMRADFFEITSRTLAAMSGFLFRKDPQVMAPGDTKGTQENATLTEFFRDATLTGQTLYDLSRELTDDVLGKGRVGVLIDWSEIEKQPFCVRYCAENIINWRVERINGRMMLTMLMLYEQDNKYINLGDGTPEPDPYEVTYYEQWRELNLESDGQGGYFASSTLWRRVKPKSKSEQQGIKGTGPAPGSGVSTGRTEFKQVGYAVPMRGGKTLSEIPFVFASPEGIEGDKVCKPPLYGMALKNLSHYRTSADLENARHVLGMPTPWAAGFTDEEADELYLGSTAAWTTENANAKCGFLALTSADMSALDKAIDQKERQMAQLGARMLDTSLQQGRQPEAFATVALRQSGETSVLMRVSLSLTQSMTDILGWALWWSGNYADRQVAEDEVGYTLNTDFLAVPMDAPMLTAVVGAYQAKAISFDTLFAKLQAGEVIEPDVEMEEEKKRIDDQAAQDQQKALEIAQATAKATPPPPPPPAGKGKQPPPPPAKGKGKGSASGAGATQE